MNLVVGGISVAALIFGIVEAAKQFGVTGKWSQALAMVLGFLFIGLAQAISQGLIPAEALPWIELVVTALAGALAANGWYDFGKRVLTRN